MSSRPLSVKDLFVPSLGGRQTHEAAPRVNTDRADLITKVYTDMGIFSPEEAEQAPEVLRSNPLINQIGSFIVVNLTPEHNLESLMASYSRGRRCPTIPWPTLWNQYSLADINRRTVPEKSGVEPAHGEIRVHTQTLPENERNETGLVGVNKDLETQRKIIGDSVVLNLTDYVLLQKIRQEEGLDPLDRETYTRFPQMDYRLASYGSCVGKACWDGGRLRVNECYGSADYRVGYRLSETT